MPRSAALIFLFTGLWVTLHAQTVPSTPDQPKAPAPKAQIKDLKIPRIATRPQLEQFLNGASRADMLQVDDFRQRSPGDGVPVSQRTSAWLGYDEKNLYAVFVCHAPPGQLRARLGKREDILSDDIVAIFLDTYHDHQRSYEFFVNPYGIQADAITNEGQDDDFSFDTLWDSDGRVTPEGFVVTLAIPFKSLRFAATDMQTWGLGLGRFIPTNNESSFWPYVTQRVSGFSPQLGNMSGLESISPGRNLQLIPYFTLGHGHFLDNPGTDGSIPVYRASTDARAGLDAKIVLHDSLTLDVALKPDFSQVESDDPQVTVNQRYEVQFSEKRPFFIENNGFFVTPENLFFSRRIIDPQYGARLTGKLGRWDLGLLAIDDLAPGVAVGPADPAYGKRAWIGVARVQREIGKQSSFGFLFTDREFAGSFNRVGAVDTRLKLNKNWTLNAQLMASQTRDTTGVRSGGDASNISLQGQDRNYYYNFTYTDRAEGFNTDLGFVPRVNIRKAEQYSQYRFHPKSKALISWGPQLDLLGDLDHRNVQQDWTFQPGIQVEMARSTYLSFHTAQIFERFNNINFRRNSVATGGHTEYFRQATFDWGYSRGTRINYTPATNLNAFLGHGDELQFSLTLRPTKRLKIDEIYNLTRLRTDVGSFAFMEAPPVTQPATVFVNHLWRSRFNYQYNRQLSLRVIVDYNGLLQNPALIDLDRQKRVTGDILLTWLLHPGTAFYLGYTDTVENLALIGGDPNLVVRTNLPSTTTGRQIFAKVSYLFRF